MRPPIYPGSAGGTDAVRYLHRARMFRAAAVQLPDYSNAEQFWPKYALLTHAIELALKAFAFHSIASGKATSKEPKQHDLKGWYHLAVHYGLADDSNVATNISLLNQLHATHYTRYPQDRAVPDASVIADTTVDHLIFIFTQAINPG
jgi:hypothetical protein